jgi:hypothetical protein
VEKTSVNWYSWGKDHQRIFRYHREETYRDKDSPLQG